MNKTFPMMAVIALTAGSASAAPLDDVVNWCINETGAPSQAIHMAPIMPDGNPRGMRAPATLTAEARKAKQAGNCDAAVDWLLGCVSHDEGAKNVLRADKQATCSKL